jgi:cell wall-associated NlpC family hydrolase
MRRSTLLILLFGIVLPLLACGPIAQLSDQAPGSVPPGGSIPVAFDELPPDDPRAIAINFALAQVGKPYTQYPGGPVHLWCGRGGGGCTRNGPDCYDCSGLTAMAYRQAAITIGPTTAYQVHDGVSVPCQMSQLNGTATTCWQPGDLAIFMRGGATYHVAMYVSDGTFVESYNCQSGVIYGERSQASMANLGSVRRIVVGGLR